MLKEIERATLKITQAMEKNRIAFNEAEEWYRDTGYDRYFKKMNRLDEEYEEYRRFLHIEEEPVQIITHEEEYFELLKKIKAQWYYLKFDIPATPESNAIDELLMDVN